MSGPHITDAEFDSQTARALDALKLLIEGLVKNKHMDVLPIIVAINMLAASADAQILEMTLNQERFDQFTKAFKKSRELYRK